MLDAAKLYPERKFVIVDHNYEEEDMQIPENVITSAMKRVDIGVFDIISKAKNGEFEGGKAVIYGLKEDAVGIAPTTSKNVPKEILDFVEKQKQDIIDGKKGILKSISDI